MTVHEISHSRLRVDPDGPSPAEPLLALDTGVPAGGFPAQRISALARRGGILVYGDRAVPWPTTRLLTFNGRLYLCGPWVAGTTLDELVSAGGVSDDTVAAVAQGMAKAVETGGHILCNTGTSLVTDDGGVLLLDDELAGEINRYLPLERRRQTVFPYRINRLLGQSAGVYQTGAVLWHLVTGQPVCREPTEEKSDRCHDRVRSHPAIHRVAPRIRPDVARSIERLITDPDDPEGVRTIRKIAAAAQNQGIGEEISDEEARRRRQAAEESVRKSDRSWARRQFVQHRGRTVLIAVVLAVLVGTVPFQIIRNRLSPPSTAGLGPVDVATRFYEAWQDFDHAVMDDALAKGVADGLMKEVTNVFVMARVQTAYGSEGNIVSAPDWIAAGKPQDKLPYGPVITDFTVLRRGETETFIVVDYEMWRPDSPDEEEGAPFGTVSVMRDRLTLTTTRWGWEISEIITTMTTPPTAVPPAAPAVSLSPGSETQKVRNEA